MSTSAVACVVAFGVLCWTWLAYPAVVWLLSRTRHVAPLVGTDAAPTVTAVLASRDDAQSIVARVRDFLAADYPADRLTVVVGIDGGTPESLAAMRDATDATRVTFVRADAGLGKVAGLNAAVRAATGDVLVFSDTHQRFAPDAIRRLVSSLIADPRLGAVSGALQLPGDLPGATGRSPVEWYWFFERRLRAAEARIHSCVGVSGSIYATWRSSWEPMPSQLILDDVWHPMRLVMRGKRIGYDVGAKAWDARSTTSASEKIRKVRTLTGNFQLVAWMPALLVPFRNPIWLAFVSHKLLRLLTPWLLLLLLYGAAGMLLDRIGTDAMLMVVRVLAAAAVVVLLLPTLRTKVLNAVAWGWSLQVALVQATVNGVRGRWDVWH